MSAHWPERKDVAAFYPPPVPTPAVSEREQERLLYERAVEDRESSGLPIDRETVLRAIANSTRADYPLPGIFCTPEEQQEDESAPHDLADRVEELASACGAQLGLLMWIWQDGRRVLIVPVASEVAQFQQLLRRELESDRIIITQTQHSMAELEQLQDEISEDRSALKDLGITVSSTGIGSGGVTVEYFAADPDRALRLLLERYPSAAITFEWAGASYYRETPHPFGSWIVDDTRLTVFYAAGINGEQPGSCSAEEHADRVVVTLTQLLPPFMTLMGGFKPGDATVELSAPLGDRIVIDGADCQPRPEWTGRGG